MKDNWIFIAYYIYAVLIVFGTGYVVFFLNRSGWWFVVTLVLIGITPSIKSKSDKS